MNYLKNATASYCFQLEVARFSQLVAVKRAQHVRPAHLAAAEEVGSGLSGLFVDPVLADTHLLLR